MTTRKLNKHVEVFNKNLNRLRKKYAHLGAEWEEALVDVAKGYASEKEITN
jgi:hypothetical protein